MLISRVLSFILSPHPLDCGTCHIVGVLWKTRVGVRNWWFGKHLFGCQPCGFGGFETRFLPISCALVGGVKKSIRALPIDSAEHPSTARPLRHRQPPPALLRLGPIKNPAPSAEGSGRDPNGRTGLEFFRPVVAVRVGVDPYNGKDEILFGAVVDADLVSFKVNDVLVISIDKNRADHAAVIVVDDTLGSVFT